MRQKIFSLLSIAALTACSSQSMTELSPASGSNAPQAAVDTGIWKISNCSIEAKRADITLKTDTSLSNELMYMKISSDLPLGDVPSLKMNTLPGYGLRLEGTGRHFGFEIPYSPAAVARFLHPNSFITVTYQLAGQSKAVKAVFSTSGMAEGVVQASENCGRMARR